MERGSLQILGKVHSGYWVASKQVLRVRVWGREAWKTGLGASRWAVLASTTTSRPSKPKTAQRPARSGLSREKIAGRDVPA